VEDWSAGGRAQLTFERTGRWPMQDQMVWRKAIHFSEPATTRLCFWGSIQSPDLAGKRIERLREAIPALKRFAILAWLDYAGTVLDVGAVHAASKGIGLEVVNFPVHSAIDIDPAFASFRPSAASSVRSCKLAYGTRIAFQLTSSRNSTSRRPGIASGVCR
jgi:hypothetical protein